jgi:hypothetical protein
LGDETKLSKFGDDTRDNKLGDETKLSKFGDDTRDNKLGVETRLNRLGVEIRPLIEDTYPDVPNPLTVEAN